MKLLIRLKQGIYHFDLFLLNNKLETIKLPIKATKLVSLL